MVINRGEQVSAAAINLILLLVGFVSLFPLLFVVSMSLTPYSEVIKNGGFLVIPKSVTFEAYKYLFQTKELPQSMLVSLFTATVGTAVNLLLTMLGAYPLSRRLLPGRKVILLMIVFTMLFNGGLVPTYLLIQSLGMLNTVWALIIPSAVATYNLLIMKTFFEGLPEELFESARIDGAGELRILFRVVVPLSVPSLMTVGLFYAVSNWNSFFAAVLYITDSHLNPLQIVVRKLLLLSNSVDNMTDIVVPTPTLQMASVIIASLPVLVVYPVIQKYFSKGVLIGAIKG
ncbi:carbohydrate ABC transporter permease [Paenibacillus radicis (ex Xue et al. 2023)]|uniref:Carbohydrate ABC transporter permease n=1 Tax=Paenibacillus radicis (ex Xue et al. 2023) TaxID=2972489 RepID=A0ABT1YLE7_9BACL|nr:carbohydrate ABC transporter permease [Paenibacillus radicis (ex Xue et al. 2023)]MCR8632760.1 carbohydrate ABC transporter permease [Paenibacillus radicis (ex Xue et al. 2023)]